MFLAALEAWGVVRSRVEFMSKASRSEYLSWYHGVDLVLDTFPYNAHATASDALWAGVPVVTCRGRSFAARVAAGFLANLGLEDAIIALGCLLRGETAHYEAIYNEVARGIGQAQQETGIPHSFGVLTCETLEQALNRAGIKAGNKGFEAAAAAIEMVSLKRKLSQGGRA